MEKITSLQNNLVKHALDLREARHRREEGMTVIDGAREIKRALDTGISLDKVFFVQGQQDVLLKQLVSKKIELIEVSDKVMEKLSFGERHEGILALAKPPFLSFNDLKLSPKPLVVVLESLEKPGNLGLFCAPAMGLVLKQCWSVTLKQIFIILMLSDPVQAPFLSFLLFVLMQMRFLHF